MIKVIKGDITKVKADVIVNAANEYLYHGGGVALAISRAGGPVVTEESKRWIKEHGKLNTTEVAVTSAGKLNAKWVIHAVGPRGTKPELLKKTIENVLDKAIELGAKSIALPAISCGIFGFDKKLGAEIIYNVCKHYLSRTELDIYLVSTDEDIIQIWKTIVKNEERG